MPNITIDTPDWLREMGTILEELNLARRVSVRSESALDRLTIVVLTRQTLLLSFAASCLAARQDGQLNYTLANQGERSTRKCSD